MSDLTGSERVDYVRDMFTRIAHRYDLVNRLMTAGQDVRWRREVIRRAEIVSDATILDLGAGTGDLAREALRQVPDCHPVAVDLTMEMMRVGRERNASQAGSIAWVSSDALTVPFPEHTFNAVVSGFLLRNVIDLQRTLAEQFRTLKPGGRLVALDTTQPSENLLSPLVRFHLDKVVPTMGSLLAGDQEAYRYLPETTRNFLPAERLAILIQQAGFQDVGFRRLMFGAAAIHWGKKVDHDR
jgi:demethylmenaquinone methyltransferase / 2-methoxy-6-polyprenyl-1,4-benzoquinol methylase